MLQKHDHHPRTLNVLFKLLCVHLTVYGRSNSTSGILIVLVPGPSILTFGSENWVGLQNLVLIVLVQVSFCFSK